MSELLKLFEGLKGQHLVKPPLELAEEANQRGYDGIDCCDVMDTCCDSYCDSYD